MFQVGDKIVHPMHGAGIIDSIVQKKVNGVVRDYYILKLPVGGMLVMIPTANSEEIGVRPVVKGDEADRVIAAIPDIEVDMTPNWNRRYRENMLRLKSESAGGGPCSQGPDAPRGGARPVHRGAEDAPLGQADFDLRDCALAGCQL